MCIMDHSSFNGTPFYNVFGANILSIRVPASQRIDNYIHRRPRHLKLLDIKRDGKISLEIHDRGHAFLLCFIQILREYS